MLTSVPRWRTAPLAALALLAAGGPTATAQTATDRPRLLLIAVDGLRPDYALQADRHGLRVPTLRRFLREGAYATGVRGVVPTVTYPSLTTAITGTSPARHGIVANTPCDPLNRIRRDGFGTRKTSELPPPRTPHGRQG